MSSNEASEKGDVEENSHGQPSEEDKATNMNDAAAGATEGTSGNKPKLDFKQAMVIDDSKPMRRMLCKILSTIKFKVLEAENGKMAMEHLEKHSPKQFGIIICDLMMPVMDGAAFIAAAKSTYDEMPPIVICSSRSDREAIQMVRKLGVAGYILKPFKTETVLDKVRTTLEPPEESDESADATNESPEPSDETPSSESEE